MRSLMSDPAQRPNTHIRHYGSGALDPTHPEAATCDSARDVSPAFYGLPLVLDNLAFSERRPLEFA
jgi:hypothetical protein